MEPWRYEPALDLDQPLIERLRRFPREPDMLVYGIRFCTSILIRGWLKGYHRFTITGRENLPTDRSFVLVANHTSHLDTLCLLSVLPVRDLHRTFPAAAKDYFFVSTPQVILTAVVINALPFERRIDPRRSLSLCRHLLEMQRSVLLLFPEGTRSMTGEIGEFKPGIGLILAGTEHPVVPCYLEGARGAWPKSAWFPRPRRLRLTIGLPRDYSTLKPGKESALRIARELRAAVASLAQVKDAPGERKNG